MAHGNDVIKMYLLQQLSKLVFSILFKCVFMCYLHTNDVLYVNTPRLSATYISLFNIFQSSIQYHDGIQSEQFRVNSLAQGSKSIILEVVRIEP